MKKTVLTVEQLTKIYYPSFMNAWRGQKSFTAVNGISFSLGEGEILGLLGPNGAGKTTTTQMLLSTLTPTSGTINYFGKDFFKHRSEILQQVSFASAYVKMPGRLTIMENLDVFGRLYGLSRSDRAAQIEKFLKFFEMWDLRDRETGGLSAGQMTRVMLAKAFLTRPKILLLDEPTASLDPDVAHDTLKFIAQRQQQDGVSILFTSHNMEEVVELCQRVLVLQDGVVIADDAPAKLAASVATARISLVMSDENMIRIKSYVQQEALTHEIEANSITIEVDEHQVAHVLSALGTAGVWYDQISIDRPTLKDYFIQVSEQSRKKKQKLQKDM